MTRRLHVAQLVLPAGVVGRQRVREAAEHELARLARAGAPAGGGQVAQAQGEVSAKSDARTLGRAAAAAAAAALKGG